MFQLIRNTEKQKPFFTITFYVVLAVLPAKAQVSGKEFSGWRYRKSEIRPYTQAAPPRIVQLGGKAQFLILGKFDKKTHYVRELEAVPSPPGRNGADDGIASRRIESQIEASPLVKRACLLGNLPRRS
jgi:hypothetical protein